MGWRRGHSIKDVRASSGLNLFNMHESIIFFCAPIKPSVPFFLEIHSKLFILSLFYTLLGADARREARKAFLAFSTDENMKETSDSLVSETEAETSLGPEFSEDIKISESTPVS